MRIHANIRVFGLVQGVFFRQGAVQKAVALGICGFARNEPDGSVYLEAEGEEDAVLKFVNWCYSGPEMAQVTAVNIERGVVKNFREFESF